MLDVSQAILDIVKKAFHVSQYHTGCVTIRRGVQSKVLLRGKGTYVLWPLEILVASNREKPWLAFSATGVSSICNTKSANN